MGLETLGLIRNFGFAILPWKYDENNNKYIRLGDNEQRCDDDAIREGKFQVRKFDHTTMPFEFVEG